MAQRIATRIHSPRIAAQFLRVFHQIDVTALAPRERQLLELIAQGRDNAQIAASLELTEKTVRNHITSIFAKLEVENRGQAIVLAREAGLGSRLR